jgi:hypothetical protein
LSGFLYVGSAVKAPHLRDVKRLQAYFSFLFVSEADAGRTGQWKAMHAGTNNAVLSGSFVFMKKRLGSKFPQNLNF